jgi:cytochrome o ubiquinol oxidase subunit 2
MKINVKRSFSSLAPLLAVLVSGCDWALVNPAGFQARQQSNMIVFATLLMLLIVVPVISATLFFAWKYRVKRNAEYDPNFYHSNKLEVLIWGAPIAIIAVLGTVTWGATHLLDPFRPLTRIDSNTVIAGAKEDHGAVEKFATLFIDPKRGDQQKVVEAVESLEVEVTALDWKWLFIYPELGIATVNEVAAPVNRPIRFKITSASMMNSFYIPSLSGQIYAMTGMQTQLNAVINREGVYRGFSGNYTGNGFSQMYFYFHGLSNQAFDQWVEKVRGSDKVLDRSEYLVLDRFDQKNERGNVEYFGIRHYGQVEDKLFHAILNMCVTPGMMCMDEMMHIDMAGGGGTSSIDNFKRLQYDRRRDLSTLLELSAYSGVLPKDILCTAENSPDAGLSSALKSAVTAEL